MQDLPIKKGEFGAVPTTTKDPRNKLITSFGFAKPDWNKGFLIEPVKDGWLKSEHQGQSLSCVGQAFSKYSEVLHWYDTGEVIDLSAKDVYSRIALPRGGAQLRTGAKEACKGVAREIDIPSYDINRNPLSEIEMRKIERTPEITARAEAFKGKSYYDTQSKIDLLAYAIELGHGAPFGVLGSNDGWGTADVRYIRADWGHGIFGVGYCIRNGKRTIIFQNSWSEKWGDKGLGYLNEDYFDATKNTITQSVFDGWTIVDDPNKKEPAGVPFKTIKVIGKPEIYIVNEEKKRIVHIKDQKDAWDYYKLFVADAESIREFVEVPELPSGYTIIK